MDDGGEPDFGDPEGYVDNVDDETLLGDLLQQQPKESDGIDSVIVVDGIPTVASERIDKLKGVIRKIYSKVSAYHLLYWLTETTAVLSQLFCRISSIAIQSSYFSG